MGLLRFDIQLFGLTLHSLWLEVAANVYLASLPLKEIRRHGISLQEPNPPPFHLLLHHWLRVFGPGEGAVPLLSALLAAPPPWLPAVCLLGRGLLFARLPSIRTSGRGGQPIYPRLWRVLSHIATQSSSRLHDFSFSS